MRCIHLINKVVVISANLYKISNLNIKTQGELYKLTCIDIYGIITNEYWWIYNTFKVSRKIIESFELYGFKLVKKSR